MFVAVASSKAAAVKAPPSSRSSCLVFLYFAVSGSLRSRYTYRGLRSLCSHYRSRWCWTAASAAAAREEKTRRRRKGQRRGTRKMGPPANASHAGSKVESYRDNKRKDDVRLHNIVAAQAVANAVSNNTTLRGNFVEAPRSLAGALHVGLRGAKTK